MNANLGEASTGRANNIDFLRFALASLVIFSHSYSLAHGSNDLEPFARATGGQRSGGELAVDGFFILSGFLIARSWLSSRDAGDYLRRRALRIYPGFLVASAFTSLVAAPLLQADPSAYWRAFSARSFLARSFNLDSYIPMEGVTVNGSLWSIRYEFMCYLAVAAMGLAGVLTRRWFLALAWLACAGVFAGQIYRGWELPGSRLSWLYGFPGFWPRVMADFLAGVLFHAFRGRIALNRAGLAACSLGLLAAGVLFPGAGALPLVVPLLGGYVLFYASFAPAGRLRHFAARGDLSYGLYLYAFPVQALIRHRYLPGIAPLPLFFLAWAISAVLAALSWRLVERPSLRLKRSSRPAGARPELEPASGAAAPGD